MTGSIRKVAAGLWIFFLIVVSSFLVNLAVQRSVLIAGSPFLVVVPIVGLMLLNAREELVGWGLFTVWLSSTYLASGVPMEYAASFLIVALAIAGVLYKPMILPFVWIAHVAWDFVPRELPLLMQDLPVACLIFDGIIGVYLFWRLQKLRSKLPPLVPFFKPAIAQV